MVYAQSVFRGFEIYLRTGSNSLYDDNLLLKSYISSIVTCEKTPGIHTIKDLSGMLLIYGPNHSIILEKDDISTKKKIF